ncbi:hypothetical protein M0811_03973 [Anaeramoeba ignava]|uniref:Endonuclease/exonuclease/phosphatase domain-containing protein n=1 Tax=Anaeramoeba ignava TaxID=1746090 RepID=A0A9Q0RID3_ANAIG|nr:hypothetical protein M0811_03973 [Anaeramoeba ignava]
MESKNLIKIASFNVHMWSDRDDTFSIERFKKTIEKNLPDILCLQEVVCPFVFPIYDAIDQQQSEECEDALKYLANTFGMEYHFYPSYQSDFGNAILFNKSKLKGEQILYKEVSSKKNDKRSFGVVSFDFNSFTFDVCCTHLDHISEETRLKQLDEIFNSFKENQIFEKYHFFVGDFNSLSLAEDYSLQNWEKIEKVRRKNFWELPKLDVYKRITQKENYIDCWKKIHPEIKDEFTCWAQTRIDYIFASQKVFQTESPFKLLSSYSINSNASDHKLIISEFLVDLK